MFYPRSAALLLLVWASQAVAQTTTESPVPGAPRLTSDLQPVIRVSSTPPGADISVDGFPCGKTPALIAVSPGLHEVVVEIGARRARATVSATSETTTELVLELGLPEGQVAALIDVQPPWQGTEAGPPAEGEVTMFADTPTSPGPPPPPTPPPHGQPWYRRIPSSPWLELRADGGFVRREFQIALRRESDSRTATVGMDSNLFGTIGLSLSFFPLATSRLRGLRGLSLEGRGLMALGVFVERIGGPEPVDAMYYDLDLGPGFQVMLGRPEAGVTIHARLLWHRTVFYLGRYGNEYVPPFFYDGLRLGLDLLIPLATPHLMLQLQGSYLPIISVGEHAIVALGEERGTHGGEVLIGLVARIGTLELGAAWVGKWFSSRFEGTGYGWSETEMRLNTHGPSSDSYQQLRLSTGFRF